VILVSVTIGGVPGSASAAPGTQTWVRRYDGRAHLDDHAYALDVSPDGARVFVTGSSDEGETSDYATVAYDASSGVELWVKRYDGRAHFDDFARTLEVSSDGSAVFVTVRSMEATSGDDYATVSYDAATGTKL
jgi:DNA-binding beta-propeller fold protein YncE